ncbi:CATRA system-associated protein [Phytohabitans rumicis]|uniref:CATRA system-associated protein n=1 Tax=Phytohabitans rumicis TaxID=1076125 RepID=UPI0031EBC306
MTVSRAKALALLRATVADLVARARLTPAAWLRVEEILDEVDRAAEAGDVEALALALDELDRLRPRDSRLEPHSTVSAPEPVRRHAAWVGGVVRPPGSTHRPDVPSSSAERVAPPPVRFVNTVLAAGGTDEPVPPDRPLYPDARYELLVNIGAPRRGSLLSTTDGGWPDDLLPDGDLALRAVLLLDSRPQPLVAAFTLPAQGESFACDCPAGGGHGARCAPRPWVRFGLTTPAGGTERGQLIIYYEAVAVHVQRLALPVGDAAGGPTATLIYRLTTTFANLRSLAERTASILVPDDPAARLIVNGLSFVDNPFAVEANLADAAVRVERDLLYDAHLSAAANGAESSRYDAEYRKPREEFVADLRKLAEFGRRVYTRLFPHLDVERALPDLIRQEARARGRPAVLSVAEAVAAQGKRLVPWAMLYDLPVGSEPDTYQVCESVYRFGPGGEGGPPPAHCPFPHPQPTNVLCLFGFWGLSCELEQPPTGDRDPATVVTETDPPASVLLAAGSDLEPEITVRHVSALRAALGAAAVASPTIDSSTALAHALAGESMDVAYLYCHCGYRQTSDREPPSSYLVFGGGHVDPLDVDAWTYAPWPSRHWATRRPLVVLNGCHTVDVTSGTLGNFVEAFVRRAGAAGMIGTEVAVEQGLASLFMESFLARFMRGATAGDALRRARWDLVARGNVTGLAYTPYCLAGLRIRPARLPAQDVVERTEP